uniref:LRRCT domain-containing protein n=1 Tax=Branchiostoma floridae TaxID=7739 RepID=C3YDN4_BRAFL|eukprot:XP_002605493.1 hypothetical protein BRAFLDRAFT_92914 [Branchiostoma floridae]
MCREESRWENVPHNIGSSKRGATSMGKVHQIPWIVCDGLNGSVATVSITSFPLLPCICTTRSTVAISGYAFGVLSARTVANHSRIINLALQKSEITDIEDDALAGLTAMGSLDLSYNRLTHVKQSWFTGLTNLLSLTLSMNRIVRMDPGCFQDLPDLSYLYLNGNLLRTVEPGWFLGLTRLFGLNLESNCIEVIAAGTFQNLTKLYKLQLGGNGLSRLDGGTFRGLDSVIDLGIIGSRRDNVTDLDSNSNNIAHNTTWSLDLSALVFHDFSFFRGQEVFVRVSNRLLCIINDYGPQTFSWTFDSSSQTDFQQDVHPCMTWNLHSQEVTTRAPFVVLIKSDPYVDDDVRCKQAWRTVSPTVALLGGLNLRLVHIGDENAGKEILAVAFDRERDPNAGSNYSTQNITCFPLTEDKSNRLVFHGTQMFNKTYSDSGKICIDKGGGLTAQELPGQQTALSGQQTALPGQQTALPGQQTALPGQQTILSGQTTLSWVTSPTILGLPAQDKPDLSRLLVSSALGALLLVTIVGLLVKRYCLRPDIRVNRPRAVSGRARSASLPVISRVPHRKVSRRSLPSSLSMIENIYDEILDEAISAACRPLPALPHTYWGIPDDDITAVAMSTSLPAITNPTKKVLNESVSCRSLPALLRSIEPTYGDIPDDDDDRLLFYAAATDLTLPFVAQTGEMYSTHHNSVTTYLQPHKTLPVGHVGVYGRGTVDNSHRVTLYGNVEEDGQRSGARGTKGNMASVSSREGQATRPYMNARNVQEMYYHGRPNSDEVSQSEVSLLGTLPNTYWPWRIPTNGQLDRSRPVSLIITPPNTYWPWEIRGGRSQGRPRRASLPSAPTLLCETSEQRTMSSVPTLPNTYWPWEIPTNGQLDRSRPVPPMVTLTNTYWPWEIKGASSPGRLRRASLPSSSLVCETSESAVSSLPSTLPNTYWPWEIPTNGQLDRSRPVPPMLTPTNTYWPWEIRGTSSPGRLRRSSLPSSSLVCETSEQSAGPSLPSALPNTYWPWEIPTNGQLDRLRPVPPMATLPNTYWPWEIPTNK